MAEHTHEYDCIVCGAHFDRQKDLADHNQREHIAKAVGNEFPRQPDDDKKDDEKETPPDIEKQY